jgi:hypothetical protein
MLTSDLIDAANVLIKFAVQYIGSTWTENILRAVNSLRCMLSSIGDSIINYIASAYWVLATLGLEKEIDPYLNEAY